jgi:O-antigen/teichoic acid export membrane protein
VLVNAVSARSLGPVDFGRIYLATTFATFAFLFVEWGQQGTLIGKVAVNRQRAGELLGSALAWRTATLVVVWLLLPLICFFIGYDRDFVVVLALVLVSFSILTVASACQDVLRGFERTDFAAATYVGWQLLTACVVIPTLLLGGGIRGLLTAQIACALASVCFVVWMLPRMHVPKVASHAATVRELFLSGRAFLIFAVIMQLQPLIDAAMLAKFATADAVGWHAAARKLVGLLIYPASAIAIALYPTLCRLHKENSAEFIRTTVRALHLVTIAVVPVALGCALFPELGIAIFSERAYGPAEDNLRLLSLYVLLVYFSMPLGTCLTASGKQTHWAVVQSLCVLVSVIADPPLIRWFQSHSGNGGLGVCVATVLSEILMIGAGLFLLPPGVLDKALLRKLGAAVLGGGCMVLVAFSMPWVDTATRAALAVIAYAGCLWATGAVDANQLRSARTLLRR